MAKNYTASRDGVLVRVGNTVVSLYEGGGVPEGADSAHVALLVKRGLLVEAATPDEPVTSDGGVPAKSASKANWVDFAVSQGADRAEAEGSTKEQLVEQYGSE